VFIYITQMSMTVSKSATGGAVQPATDKALFLAQSGELQLDVRVDSETVWLTQVQLAELFGIKVPAINEHLGNIYGTGELEREATIRKFRIVRQEGRRQVERDIAHYNLDAVISVGYRVNSKTATAFRQWATRTLRERLISAHRQRQLEQVQWPSLSQIALHVENKEEARALIDVIARYANTWRMLQEYDEGHLPAQPPVPTTRIKRLTLRQARAAIAGLRDDQSRKGIASNLFGNEVGNALEAVLGNIEQTFGGKKLYPSVEQRAAALLYFIIKDHAFSDGNKRIGSLLFVHYLDKNGCLIRSDGTRRFDDNALVATALLVAASDPKQKEVVMRLILAMLS
jgi:prophage maintenance system killer protein